MGKKITAIVPMRHSSERVPGKNYRLFAGEPLFHHVINSLLACPEIGTVVIDTDSPTIQTDAAQFFPIVKVLVRPEHLRAGEIPMNDVLMHTTTQVDADYFLQTHSTNPMLSADTISRAVRTFLDGLDQHDSLFSVKRLQTRLWDAQCRPINHNLDKLIRTQDLPPVFEENSCLYIFSRETLVKRGNRIGEKPMMFEMDPIESMDIDEEVDFRMAELFFLQRDILRGCQK